MIVDILFYVGIAVALYAQCSFIYSYKEFLTIPKDRDDKMFYAYLMFCMVALVVCLSCFSWLTVASVYGVKYVLDKINNNNTNDNENGKTLLMD